MSADGRQASYLTLIFRVVGIGGRPADARPLLADTSAGVSEAVITKHSSSGFTIVSAKADTVVSLKIVPAHDSV